MKRTLITIAITAVVVLTLVGIASSALFMPQGAVFNSVSRSLDGGYGGGGPEVMMEAPAAPAPGEFYSSDSSFEYDQAYEESANLAVTERLVIQNADLSIVVVDPKARMDEIAQMTKDMGGFVVTSNIYQTTYGPNNIEVPQVGMTIRIPSERLDEALDAIKKDAVDVTYENRSGEDVTSQYVDLESRLSAKRAAEKKLLEILDDAQTTEDTLAVYVQLQQIQTEIEVLVGQMKYYEESAALSAVSITLIAEETIQPIKIGGWKLQGTANDAVQDLIRFTQGFVQFLIRFVLSFLPALILIAIPLYGAFIGGRALFRRFNKSKDVVEVKEEEKK
jgi:hypothetical protein